MSRRPTLTERFSEMTIPEPMSGCLLWLGTISDRGYGTIRVNGRTERAHRVAWALRHGAIPAGAYVLHGCDNPACVNPLHLHIGDHTLNMREMASRGRGNTQKRTLCPSGHPYSPENTIWRRGCGRRWRVCRTCHRKRDVARWRRRDARGKLAARGGE